MSTKETVEITKQMCEIKLKEADNKYEKLDRIHKSVMSPNSPNSPIRIAGSVLTQTPERKKIIRRYNMSTKDIVKTIVFLEERITILEKDKKEADNKYAELDKRHKSLLQKFAKFKKDILQVVDGNAPNNFVPYINTTQTPERRVMKNEN